MHDLRWDDVREWFNPYENGSAPDVIVPNTTLDDWEALLGLIRSRSWPCEYDYRDHLHPLPTSAAALFAPDPEGWTRTLRIWPHPGLEWIVECLTTDQIDSYVSLHEIQGQERLDAFCLLLRTLGTAVGKRVRMYAEGCDEAYDKHTPMMAYEVDDDRVLFLAGPWR